jgi:hypothetical protein
VSRFEDLLRTQFPSMRMVYSTQRTSSAECRQSFEYWKAIQQEHNPGFDTAYRLGGVADEEHVWSPRKAHFLYRDRELTIDTDYWAYEDSIHRYGWYACERETLRARLQEQESWVALFSIQLGFILDVYEDDACGSAFHRRFGKDQFSHRVFEWYERKYVYNATTPFFGRAFRPLMEAFKLHLRGERGSVLYSCSARIEVSEVNRLVIENLGIQRYSCLAGGTANKLGGRCEVALSAYSESERLQVASYLMAQQRPPIAVRLLLCELALRNIIPQGTYDIQADVM